MSWIFEILQEVFVWCVEGWKGWLGLGGAIIGGLCITFIGGVPGIIIGIVAFIVLLGIGFWLDGK